MRSCMSRSTFDSKLSPLPPPETEPSVELFSLVFTVGGVAVTWRCSLPATDDTFGSMASGVSKMSISGKSTDCDDSVLAVFAGGVESSGVISPWVLK